MFDFSTLLIFMTAAAVLLIIPGPAVLYVIARSIDQGRMAGLASVLGVGVGSFVHIGAAALGVSAILASSVVAFAAIKYLGAAYLIYLGVRTLLRPAQSPIHLALQSSHRGQLDWAQFRRIFWQGVVVNALNPKTALFFLAFLPQFINPTRASATLQILTLGAIFVIMALVSDGLYALAAGTMGEWLRRNPYFLRVQQYVAGSAYILLGVTAAVSGNGRHK
ncbi:MAG: LysE family translocator [Caldilineaceae bacterium]